MIRKSLGNLFLMAIAFALPYSDVHSQPKPDRTVVVIPGILGSKLCSRASGAVIWGGADSYFHFPELALPPLYDVASLPHVPCGLIESVNVLGPLQIHQYDDLLATLHGMGYEDKKTLFVFPYDWRLSNQISASRLETFISKTLPSGDFDIVAHSMGGLVAKIWMSQGDRSSRVSTFVTFGTPYFGSATTFQTLDEGWGFWKNLLSKGLGTVRETALTFPSLYELLPSYGNCCWFTGTPRKDFDPFSPTDWERLQWLPAGFQSPERREWLKTTLSTARAISKVQVPPGPVVVTVVNGLLPTTYRVVFDATDGHVVNYIAGPGDGTVYQLSAANGHLQDARAALTRHATIFADNASRQVLRWVLTRGPEPTKGTAPIVEAYLRTADGKSVAISAASAEIVPSVLDPNQPAMLVVEITGGPDLINADLSNIVAVYESDGKPLDKPKISTANKVADRTTTTIQFPFLAPSSEGAFSIIATLPAVADIPDVAVVVRK